MVCLLLGQLLSGCSESELKGSNLTRDPEAFHYTRQGCANKVEAISDRGDHKVVLAAMKALDFSQVEIETVWKIVAAILHLVRTVMFLYLHVFENVLLG